MSVHVVAPVRCPHCRSRLTATRWLRNLSPYVRWCKRCQCTVSYVDQVDGWHVMGTLCDDGDA